MVEKEARGFMTIGLSLIGHLKSLYPRSPRKRSNPAHPLCRWDEAIAFWPGDCTVVRLWTVEALAFFVLLTWEREGTWGCVPFRTPWNQIRAVPLAELGRYFAEIQGKISTPLRMRSKSQRWTHTGKLWRTSRSQTNISHPHPREHHPLRIHRILNKNQRTA